MNQPILLGKTKYDGPRQAETNGQGEWNLKTKYSSTFPRGKGVSTFPRTGRGKWPRRVDSTSSFDSSKDRAIYMADLRVNSRQDNEQVEPNGPTKIARIKQLIQAEPNDPTMTAQTSPNIEPRHIADLRERNKVGGKVGPLGDTITITREKKKITVGCRSKGILIPGKLVHNYNVFAPMLWHEKLAVLGRSSERPILKSISCPSLAKLAQQLVSEYYLMKQPNSKKTASEKDPGNGERDHINIDVAIDGLGHQNPKETL
ncbi:hypothetical protein NE237_005979 [Protea cynaroides]|uniref:Uncharacterized protein n=1 Tax=Protea cynaroides TaxID=273540 RepID=A0A9Q0QUQ7_9MAGN|nr:hypothetical protein NE237_005979 [Protea cynaroides]